MSEEFYGQPTCSHGGIDKNNGTSIVRHDKHCRIHNDAPIHPEYENAYCTCKNSHINIPDIVERTNREISQLKMVSPETARLLLAEITRLRKAIEEHKAMTEVLCVREDFDNELYKVLEKT